MTCQHDYKNIIVDPQIKGYCNKEEILLTYKKKCKKCNYERTEQEFVDKMRYKKLFGRTI